MDGIDWLGALGAFFGGFASPAPIALLACLAPLVWLTGRAIDGRWPIGLRDPLAKRELRQALRRRREAAEAPGPPE
ncbi:MAG: hypothetical protein LBD51_02720 [Bifidobacteriaceae bacterium]|jgi:hypothetical protein|nr:hypothetical protein [Bifidobacteriaceae bacterium]